MLLYWLLSSLLWSTEASDPKPYEMRKTMWVTSFGGSESSFNRPLCKDVPAFNATCISDGTTLHALLKEALPASYVLTGAEFNIYGVTPEDTSARGFNLFVVSDPQQLDLTLTGPWRLAMVCTHICWILCFS